MWPGCLTIEYAGQHIPIRKLLTTAAILFGFRRLVKVSRIRPCREILVSIIPLWLQRVVHRECVCGTTNSSPTPIRDMGVDHHRAEILISQEFLRASDVVAVFEEVGRKRVAKRVREAALAMPAQQTASFTARWAQVAEKTHCHPHSWPAVGYFRSIAPGSATHPAPFDTTNSVSGETIG